LAKLNCHRHDVRRSRGTLYIDSNADPSVERQVILDVDQEDVWPHTILDGDRPDSVTLDYANDFIRQRTRPANFEQELAGMEASLRQPFPPTRFQAEFPDRPIHAATMAMLRTVIAKVCVEDKMWARQFLAVLTPVTQAALLLEELRCDAERALASLTERWLDCSITDQRTSHHERQVKRNLEICAHRVYIVYHDLTEQEASRGVDISEASHAAASALICMIGGALKRTWTIPPGGSSLWSEMTQLDYNPRDPEDFWTLAFMTFRAITPDGLARAQRTELRKISELARQLTHPPLPGILDGLDAIRRRSR
jgi:hypothetical protein